MARLEFWTEELKREAFKKIMIEISEKGRSLNNILLKDEKNEFPSKSTFNEWLNENENLANQYARACDQRAELLFDEIITLSDDTTNDLKPYVGMNSIQRNKLQIDARKWVLAKMNPKKFGDKTDITTNGKEITANINYSELSDAALEEIASKIKS